MTPTLLLAASLGAPCQPPADPTQVDLPDDPFDDMVVVEPDGLDAGQVEAAVDEAMPSLRRCLPTTERAQGELLLAVTVACTGQVAEVEIESNAGLAPPLVDCLLARVGQADFPAHALADGYRFDWRVEFDVR